MQEDIRNFDKKIYDVEGAYLSAEHAQCGSVVRGFEGFLSSKDNLRKRARVLKVEDRVFSLSSLSSPAHQELQELALVRIPQKPSFFCVILDLFRDRARF